MNLAQCIISRRFMYDKNVHVVLCPTPHQILATPLIVGAKPKVYGNIKVQEDHTECGLMTLLSGPFQPSYLAEDINQKARPL